MAQLDSRPDLGEYFYGYLTLTETGRLPWEMGLDLPRRRFKEAAVLLAQVFGYMKLAPKGPACPFFGSGK